MLVTNFVDRTEEYSHLWPTLTGRLHIDALTLGPMPLGTPLNLPNSTGLVRDGEYSFTGDNQVKITRWPQGVADYLSPEINHWIITSWYFSSAANANNTKFVAIDTSMQLAYDICPVVLKNGLFTHLHSHAGGLATIGSFLYVADSTGRSIRVFDLANIYSTIENVAAIDPTDDFVGLYNYFIPEVGRIFLTPTNDAPISYLSLSEDGHYLVAGNFYSTTTAAYARGGRSYIWRIPLSETPTVTGFRDPISDVVHQIEPLFPSGPNINTTMTRIQGVLWTLEDELIINRSFTNETKQLLVIKPNGQFFSGDVLAPQSHNPDNWLFRCEDLSFSVRYADRFLALTEDPGDRSVTTWSISEVLELA